MNKIIHDELAYRINPKRPIMRVDIRIETTQVFVTIYADLLRGNEKPFYTNVHDLKDWNIDQVKAFLIKNKFTIHEWNTFSQHGMRAWKSPEPWVIRTKDQIIALRDRLKKTEGMAHQAYEIDLRFDYI